MRLNNEQKLTLIYIGLGILVGIASRFLNAPLAFIIGALVYAVSVHLTRKWVRERKKLVWHIVNTIITFILVWLIVWILAFNFW